MGLAVVGMLDLLCTCGLMSCFILASSYITDGAVPTLTSPARSPACSEVFSGKLNKCLKHKSSREGPKKKKKTLMDEHNQDPFYRTKEA